LEPQNVDWVNATYSDTVSLIGQKFGYGITYFCIFFRWNFGYRLTDQIYNLPLRMSSCPFNCQDSLGKKQPVLGKNDQFRTHGFMIYQLCYQL